MAVSVKASERGLELVDLARKKKNWTKRAAAWREAALVGEAALKKFWQRIPINADNFAQICKAVGIDSWEEIVDNSPAQPTALPVSCSAYNEETWVGREELIRQLSQKLKGQCRILIITGITGLGKTALAERLATVELQEDYPNYKVVNFDEGAGTQDFVSAAENLLNRLGEKVTADERKNPNGLLNRLLQKLRSCRYLVQMDSLEVLLRGQGDDDIARNEFEDELWSVFFNGFLAGQDCQSRLILTSQDLPTQFGSRYKNFWAEEPLKGLNEAEQFELFQKLFQRKKKEIEPESEAAGYLKRMGNAYEGHPLVIEVIAGEILAFNGNVMVYWQRYRQEFEAIEPVIGHQKPQLKVKDRVRKSLKRLAHDVPNAYTLLCRSSVYRRLAPESFWLAMLGNLTEEEKAFALGILQLRYLAFDEGITSTGQFLLRQHNLIRSVAYELLRKTAKHSSEWQDAHHTAADMWCTAYEPEPDIPNLEKVRGYLEAFYHLVQVENWKGASEILFIRRDTFSNKDLGEQLFTWAYYREQIDLYSQLRGKLDQQCDAMCLVGLGNASNFLGHHRQAIEYSQQSLAIAREIGDRLLEGKALGNLGNAYNFLGEYQQAIEYYQQYLAFAPEIGDRLLEGKTLGNLGIAYKNLGQYEQAIEYYQQYLKIAREEIKDGYAEGRALGSLGAAYLSLKNYEQAIEYYQQWLVLARDIGDRNGQGNALGGLGNVYGSSGQYQQAIEYHQQWLVIARERGDLYGEAAALCNFGESLIKLEQYSEAQGKLQEALEIVRRNGYRSIEAALLKNLAELHHKWAKLHHKLGNRELGIKFCNQALALATELGIPLAQECQELNEKLLNEQM